MKTTKQEYREFLNNNFKGLKLRKPLFYNWKFGLRFDLQNEKTGTDKYYQEVERRASAIFQTVFENSDQLFLIFIDHRHKRRKIKFSNFVFRQVNKLKKEEITYLKQKGLYELNDKSDLQNIAIIKTTTAPINFQNIFKAIGNTDFPPREPRLDNQGVFTSKEVYFINLNKKLIFHMYDDRGLDIISTNIETLRPIYEKHKNWILDYDRKKIEKQFE